MHDNRGMFMGKIHALGAAVALVFSSSVLAYENYTPYEAYNMAASDPDTVILDVRTRYEWSFVGHPAENKTGEGAELSGKVFNIAYKVYDGNGLSVNPSFVDDVKALMKSNPNMKFITMCRSGSRSVAAAVALEAEGISAANMLEGFEGGKDASGYRTLEQGWKNLGLPYTASFSGSYDRYEYTLNPKGLMIPAQSNK